MGEILFEFVGVSLAQEIGMGVLFSFEDSFIFLEFCFRLIMSKYNNPRTHTVPSALAKEESHEEST
jgi:hypothetical protein